MTRKEEIKEMARTTASHITSDKDMQVAFADALRRGAEWADSHPRWISVEDELPPARDSYDCLSNQVLATDGVDICLSTYNHDEDTKAWFTYDLWPFVNVTHWMPLPVPPSCSDFPNNQERRVIGTADHIKTALDVMKKGGEE